MERRLAAILVADVVGYSRLVEVDEEGTLRTLGAYREVIDGLVVEHRGRVFGSAGDSVIAEFASPVEAVRCAVEFQRELGKRNTDLPDDRRMEFRVGVNLGDVVVEGDNLLGNGVNVAARLQELAEPGGVYISDDVYRQVEGKIEQGFSDLGDQSVKNIVKPVRVFRVSMGSEVAETPTVAKVTSRSRRLPVIAATVVLLVVAAGAALWLKPWEPREEPASIERMALPLPDKPSIAVLPFVNMSGDPEQEYFADGMTEDLITDLSKISALFVIARNSTFSYKGQQVTVRQVAEDLGVRYVLEGSVRRVGDQVRINAQLIDAVTGGHLWADRYDGSLVDVFALQDKVIHKIVLALAVNLTAGDREQRSRKETDNPDAYDAFLRGWEHYRRNRPEDYSKAIGYFERAIELDSDYGRASAALASIYWNGWVAGGFTDDLYGQGVSHVDTFGLSRKYMKLAKDRPTPLSLQLASIMLWDSRRYEEAVAEAERSIVIDSNDPESHIALAKALIFAGRAPEAVPHVEKAMRLDPLYPASYLYVLGLAHFGMNRLDEAMSLLKRAVKRNAEDPRAATLLTAVYGNLGHVREARAMLNKTVDLWGYRLPVHYPLARWPFRKLEDIERFGRGLLTAGLCCEDVLERELDKLR